MKRAVISGASLWVAFFVTSCSGDNSTDTLPVTPSASATAGAPGVDSSATPPGCFPNCPAEPGAAGAPPTGNTGGGGTAGGNTGGNTGGVGATGGNTGGAGATGTPPPVNTGGGGNTGGNGGSTSGMGGAGPTGSGDTSDETSTGTGGTTTAPDPDPPEPEPTLITSSNGNFWQVGEVTEGGGNATVTVNEGQTFQNWEGFGGTFNEAGWHALQDVSEADRERAIKLLFDKRDGAAFTWGRIPIGSSDYGMDRYSLAPQADDFEMASFSIDRDKELLIPYIKAALAVNPDLRMWASPWSPPPWMKTNNAFDRGSMRTEESYLKAHALYLARFVEEYAKEGIVVEHVQPQNEPGYPQDYPSCEWGAAQMANYIADHLGPLFAERLPDTEIWLGTMSNSNADKAPAIVSAVMGNNTARGYVKGIGLQWGMEAQASNYASQYGIHIMQTEHQCGNNPWDTGDQPVNANAPNDYAYGKRTWDLLKSWITKNVNTYLAWNMVLDTSGRNLDDARIWHQNALLVVDRGQGRLIETPAYYVFRHFAQYVEPGAVRVGTQGGDAVAFKNPDGSIVTVLYNSGGPTQATVAVGGKNLQFDMPGDGWATVNWQPE